MTTIELSRLCITSVPTALNNDMTTRHRSVWLAFTLVALCGIEGRSDEAVYQAELVFPLDDQHNHAPGIAELPDGRFLISWYRGSGERTADDVAVFGSLSDADSATWSEPFLLVDTPGFPDCNTCLMCDDTGKVWLFWPVIIANSWESCITHYRVFDPEGVDAFNSPIEHGSILLKPEDFSQKRCRSWTTNCELPRILLSPLSCQTEFDAIAFATGRSTLSATGLAAEVQADGLGIGANSSAALL